jgi:hypothetical protein
VFSVVFFLAEVILLQRYAPLFPGEPRGRDWHGPLR